VESVGKVLEGWRKDGIAFVRFELPDMHGISRSKTIPIDHAGDYAERGLNMYGGVSVLDTRSDVVPGTLYHEEVGYGDQLLFPDPESAAVIRGPIAPPASSATRGGTTAGRSRPRPATSSARRPRGRARWASSR
jgi:glutamine synthetase